MCEFRVRSYFQIGGRDSNMGFIYSSTSRLCWTFVLERVTLILWGVPKAPVVHGGDAEILSNSGDPHRYSFNSLSRRYDHGYLGVQSVRRTRITGCSAYLDLRVVGYYRLTIFRLETEFPDSKIASCHWRSIPVPAILHDDMSED